MPPKAVVILRQAALARRRPEDPAARGAPTVQARSVRPQLGRIDIHRIQIMAAAMWVKARKCGARRS